MISARQLVRDLRPSSASSALFSLPGDDVLPSRHSQPYRASAQPQGMHPRTRHTAREWCSGYPGPGVPGARLRASGTGVGSGRLPSRWFRLGPLLRRSPAQPASPPDHPTPAFPSSASLPDGNASPTVKRQRYSASTRPQGKRNQLQPLDGCPELRSGLLAGRQNGFDSGRSFVASRLNQLHPRPPNASLPVIRQPSRRERQPNRQTPALQRKHTTGRQAQPASGIAVSTRAARSSRPGSTTFGERDSPVISALTRSIPWKTAIKIEGFVRLSDISLNQPRRDPDTDHSFLFRSTSDTPGNERCRTSKSACGDRVGTFGHTESIPIPTQARGISI